MYINMPLISCIHINSCVFNACIIKHYLQLLHNKITYIVTILIYYAVYRLSDYPLPWHQFAKAQMANAYYRLKQGQNPCSCLYIYPRILITHGHCVEMQYYNVYTSCSEQIYRGYVLYMLFTQYYTDVEALPTQLLNILDMHSSDNCCNILCIPMYILVKVVIKCAIIPYYCFRMGNLILSVQYILENRQTLYVGIMRMHLLQFPTSSVLGFSHNCIITLLR